MNNKSDQKYLIELLNSLKKFYDSTGIITEGKIWNRINTLIDKNDLSLELKEFVDHCSRYNTTNIEKRLGIIHKLEETKNKERIGKNKAESLIKEIEIAKEEAENAKSIAEGRLSLVVIRAKSELTNWVVKRMVFFVGFIVVLTPIIYVLFPESQVMENLTSQVIISALSSGFSVIGTLFGVREMLKQTPDKYI